MSKFHVLLLTLSPKKLKRLCDFVCSPYFNKNEDIKNFFLCQVEAIIQNVKTELVDEQISKAVFPNEPYKRDKLYRLRSECLILLEKFIIYENIEPENGIAYLSLLYHYVQKDLPKHFEAGHKIWQYNQMKNLIYDTDFYYHAYKEEQLLSFYATKKQERRKKRKLDIQVNLWESNNLDIFYYLNILENLIYYWEKGMLMKGNMTKSDLILKTDEVIKRIKEIPKLLNNALFNFYLLLLKILKNEDPKNTFEELRAFLSDNKDKLSIHKLKNGYTLLNNFCARHANLGEKEYIQIQFQLYQDQLKQGLLYNSQGYITVASFTNIVSVALRANEQKWAVDFLEDHNGKLISEDPDMIYKYCRAKILFEDIRYTEAKYLLLQTKINDLLFSFTIRRYILKCCYETQDTQTLELEMANFKLFAFRQNLIADNQKDKNKAFYRIFKKIVDYTPYDTKKKEKLMEEINEKKSIADKAWLLQKIEALK